MPAVTLTCAPPVVTGPIGEARDPELFRQFGRDRRGRGPGIDGELERTAAIGVDIDQDQRLGRIGQTHRRLRSRLIERQRLDRFGSSKRISNSAIIERDPEMLEEIVSEIAVDFACRSSCRCDSDRPGQHRRRPILRSRRRANRTLASETETRRRRFDLPSNRGS